jgi:hypothetical protein
MNYPAKNYPGEEAEAKNLPPPGKKIERRIFRRRIIRRRIFLRRMFREPKLTIKGFLNYVLR